MTAFEIIVFAVAAFALVSSFIGPLRFDRAFQSLGRNGRVWIDHPADRTLEESGPDEERDAPIPVRPLRSRGR